MRIEVKTTCFPRLTEWHTRRVLKWIGRRDLEGLEVIEVIDECPDDPESLTVRPFLRGFLNNGHYLRKMKNRPAQVVVYARDVYFGIPTLLVATPLATLKLARTLIHEVGHHVIATRGYIYKPWEKYKPWNGIRKTADESTGKLVAHTGLEPVISALRGQRVNQLHQCAKGELGL